MKVSIKQFAFSLSLSLAVYASYASPAKSDTTGWLTPDELQTFSKKMSNDKLIPVKMECRGDSRSPSIRDSMEIKVTFAPNASDKRWRWWWGANFFAAKRFWEKHGWTQVSNSGFRRPKTGVLVPCGIFHKDRK